jgi:hypothetical protein
VAKLTLDEITPGTFATLRSIAAAQEAQVIPVICKVSFLFSMFYSPQEILKKL